MSIKGRPGTWLTSALERGDLASAISEASELPRLNLSDALGIVLLMAEQGHPSFSRAGAKWVARLGVERHLGLEDLRYALEAVAALPHHPAHARRSLVDICARYELPAAVGLHSRGDTRPEPRAIPRL